MGHENSAADVEVVDMGEMIRCYFLQRLYQLDSSIVDQNINLFSRSSQLELQYPAGCYICWVIRFSEITRNSVSEGFVWERLDFVDERLGKRFAAVGSVVDYDLPGLRIGER